MRRGDCHQQRNHTEIFRTGDLAVDLVRRIVRVGDKEVKLSPKEYELLRVLVQHAGKVRPPASLRRCGEQHRKGARGLKAKDQQKVGRMV